MTGLDDLRRRYADEIVRCPGCGEWDGCICGGGKLCGLCERPLDDLGYCPRCDSPA